MARGDSYELQGLNGSRVYNTGDTATAADSGGQGFRCLQMVTDVVLSSITAVNKANVTNYNGVTLGQGYVIWGNITGFTIASGKVDAFFM